MISVYLKVQQVYTKDEDDDSGEGIGIDGWIQGRPSPSETMMHFPSVSDFPPIFEKFSDSEENFTFSRKISLFSSAEISDDLF